MDIEFHYYMTYLIAAKAGMDAGSARVLAHSSQFIDDNDIVFEVDKGQGSAYRNYISQTMNILKPKEKLLRIYPIFHFIPGDPRSETAWRKDGKMHWLCTTPNSANANAIMDAALGSQSPHRIGVAAHGYVDTWAHQNFIGYYDDFNAMDIGLGKLTPNIGHADAGHNPDWPALVWRDPRLIEEGVDNKERFLDAARHLLEKLARFADGSISDREVARRQDELTADLSVAIGERDQANDRCEERTERYLDLARRAEYGDTPLPRYDEDLWFDEAVNEDVRGLRDRGDAALLRFDPFTDKYTWKDSQAYRRTDWYLFQEAVKVHQDETWDILAASNLKGLDLEAL